MVEHTSSTEISGLTLSEREYVATAVQVVKKVCAEGHEVPGYIDQHLLNDIVQPSLAGLEESPQDAKQGRTLSVLMVLGAIQDANNRDYVVEALNRIAPDVLAGNPALHEVLTGPVSKEALDDHLHGSVTRLNPLNPREKKQSEELLAFGAGAFASNEALGKSYQDQLQLYIWQ